MGEVQWIKLSTGTFDTSRKIKQIENMNDGDTILVIWFKLLCMAGAINDGGAIYITPEVPYDEEALADELRRDVDIVEKALETFEKFGMIHRDDVGFIRLSSWEKHQNIEGLDKIREPNRLRQKKWYDKQKALTSSNGEPNVSLTSPNALEEDIEEEKEKEEEFHSIVHSAREEETCIERKIEQEGFEGHDAEVYRQELKERLRRKYMGGELGQGVVFISEEQFSDLLNKLSLDEIDKYFGIIVDCETKGKRYKKKTHYQAILEMARKDRLII